MQTLFQGLRNMNMNSSAAFDFSSLTTHLIHSSNKLAMI